MKKIFVLFLMVCSLIMITACKPKEYTVTLKFEDGAVFETITVKKGESTTLNTPSKDGHTFNGWYMGTELIDGSQGFKENTELVAKFTINTYTYKFIVEGNVIKETSATYGSSIVLPARHQNDTIRKAGERLNVLGRQVDFLHGEHAAVDDAVADIITEALGNDRCTVTAQLVLVGEVDVTYLLEAVPFLFAKEAVDQSQRVVLGQHGGSLPHGLECAEPTP